MVIAMALHPGLPTMRVLSPLLGLVLARLASGSLRALDQDHIIAAQNGEWESFLALLANGAPISIGAKNADRWSLLHFAARDGRLDAVIALLERGADRNAKNAANQKPLCLSALNGHLAVARALFHDPEETMLHYAALNGYSVLVHKLLAEHFDKDAKDSNMQTALHLASLRGHPSVVQALLANGANVNVENDQKRTPLHYAAMKGFSDIVEALLSRGAVVNVWDNAGLTPLHYAAIRGCSNTAKELLKHGADKNAENGSKQTPLQLALTTKRFALAAVLFDENTDPPTLLHYAAQRGLLDIIKWCLNADVDWSEGNANGSTPLDLAVQNGHLEIARELFPLHDKGMALLHYVVQKGLLGFAEKLLGGGEDVNLKDTNQCTPLHYAAREGHLHIVEMLLTREARVDALNSHWQTPLHFAFEHDHLEVASLLVGWGAVMNAADKSRQTPLYIAVRRGHLRPALMLFDTSKFGGSTPLHLAVIDGHLDIVSMLLEHKVKVNAKDKEGLTPLHLAIKHDRPAIVSVLLEHGAEKEAKDKDGLTPLNYAVIRDGLEASKVLLEKSAQDKDCKTLLLKTTV